MDKLNEEAVISGSAWCMCVKAKAGVARQTERATNGLILRAGVAAEDSNETISKRKAGETLTKNAALVMKEMGASKKRPNESNKATRKPNDVTTPAQKMTCLEIVKA